MDETWGRPRRVHPPYPRRGLDPAFQAGNPTDQGPYSVFPPLPRTALYLFSAAWAGRVPLAPPRCTCDVNLPEAEELSIVSPELRVHIVCNDVFYVVRKSNLFLQRYLSQFVKYSYLLLGPDDIQAPHLPERYVRVLLR